MAKKRSTKKSKKSSKTARALPLWRLWLFSGLVIALCLLVLQFFQKEKLKPSLFSAMFSENKAPEKPKHLAPAFEFYETLPKEGQKLAQKKPALKDKIPDVSIAKTEMPTTTLKQKSDSPKLQAYVLQVASVKTFDDADKIKASLILQGYAASIQTAKVNNETRYRIMVGPFTDKELMAAAKMELNQAHYSSFAVASN